MGLAPERAPERLRSVVRDAAVAKRAQCRYGEAATGITFAPSFRTGYANGLGAKCPERIESRASQVPAAAVIPAPIVYVQVVAVKTFVV